MRTIFESAKSRSKTFETPAIRKPGPTFPDVNMGPGLRIAGHSRRVGDARKVQGSLMLALALAFTSPAFASSDNAGTKNAEFLKIATDARGVALGDSVVSMADGIDALRWNPAGLASLEHKEAGGTHMQYYQGVQIENVGAAYPLEDSGLAINVFYLSPGDLDGRDVLGNPTGDFKFYDLAGTIGYGRKIMTRESGAPADVSLGASLKLVQEVIANETYQNPAVDAGILVSPMDDLSFGGTMRDLSTNSASYPLEILGGASYTWYKVFTSAVGIDYSNDAPIRYSVGGEFKIPQVDSVIRAGYQSHDSLDDSVDSQIPGLRKASLAGLTMGAGFDYKPPMWPSTALTLDYAMAPFGALGISHTITVKMKW